jgi:hypothetical protein
MSTAQHQTPRESIVLDAPAPVAQPAPAPISDATEKNVAEDAKSAGQEESKSVKAAPADAVQDTETANDPAEK